MSIDLRDYESGFGHDGEYKKDRHAHQKRVADLLVACIDAPNG